mmetsp:Transcript_66655/g.124435  ORF Transcript_66655/g.124435 Transcript_66655/m.124435 type:complete len:307 (+) Transcript_66655:86-1006(+)
MFMLPALLCLMSLVAAHDSRSDAACAAGDSAAHCAPEELGDVTLLQQDIKAARRGSAQRLATYYGSKLNYSTTQISKDSCTVLTTFEHDGKLLQIEAIDGNLLLAVEGTHLYKRERSASNKPEVTIEDVVFHEPETDAERASFDAAVDKLLADERTPLVLAASLKLASEGLTGGYAPCLVPMHVLASTLAGKLGIRDARSVMLQTYKRSAADHTCTECRRRNPTINGEYGTKSCDNGCYGMCGPDCDPWPICHLDIDAEDQPCFKGCEAHDYYCSCAGWRGWWECITFDSNDASPYCGDCVAEDLR